MLKTTESDPDRCLDAYQFVDNLIARQDAVLDQLEQLQFRIEDEIKRVVDSREEANGAGANGSCRPAPLERTGR